MQRQESTGLLVKLQEADQERGAQCVRLLADSDLRIYRGLLPQRMEHAESSSMDTCQQGAF